jgi:hypothetical protein
MTKKRVIANLNLDFHTKKLSLFAKQEKKIREISNCGIRALGVPELIRHLQGKRLTRDQAIRAFCADCMGWYAEGKGDCGDPLCSLHPFMPYRSMEGLVQASTGKNSDAPDRLYPPHSGNDQKEDGGGS